MDIKYKQAREKLKISLKQMVSWINDDLAEVNQNITVPVLFRIEEGIRRKHDIKTVVSEKWYKRLVGKLEYEKKVKEIYEKYGG